jgi:hypothetical protein
MLDIKIRIRNQGHPWRSQIIDWRGSLEGESTQNFSFVELPPVDHFGFDIGRRLPAQQTGARYKNNPGEGNTVS